jgi:hypothetical protein
MRDKEDVHEAMRVPGLGHVAFVYGRPGDAAKDFRGGYGLAHIEAKHGAEALDRVPEVLAHGSQSALGPTRIAIKHEGHNAILTHGGSGPEGPWLLTAYQEDEVPR